MKLLLFFLLPLCLGQPCGYSRCGYRGYAGYAQPPQAYQPALPRPVPQELYYERGYATPPAAAPPQVLASIDKDTVDREVAAKMSEYDKFEEKLSQLKPEAPVVEPPSNITATTYIREYPQVAPPPPPQQAYRPLPYYPQPHYKGCPPVPPPHYAHPLPYSGGYATAPVPYPPHSLPAPQIHPPIVPPINDCCGRCRAPCLSRSFVLAHAQSSKTAVVEEKEASEKKESPEPKDSRCTSEKLRKIMQELIQTSPTTSKRLIQKAAEKLLGGFFSVFCSRDDFSYVARTETFCQLNKNDLICYAFQHN